MAHDSTLSLALDAQLFLRTQVRIMLIGTAELTQARIIMPETALLGGANAYRNMCFKYAETIVKHEAQRAGLKLTEDEADTITGTVWDRVDKGFREWIEREPRTNSACFQIAPGSTRTKNIAISLRRNGVALDHSDTRWETGEDPQVIAEALQAGARWVSSDNLKIVSTEMLDEWMQARQRKGEFANAHRPFVIGPDAAMREMVDGYRRRSGEPMEHAALYKAVFWTLCDTSAPHLSLAAKVTRASGRARQIKAGGLHVAGSCAETWCNELKDAINQGQPDAALQSIRKVQRWATQHDLVATISGERRRKQAEAASETAKERMEDAMRRRHRQRDGTDR